MNIFSLLTEQWSRNDLVVVVTAIPDWTNARILTSLRCLFFGSFVYKIAVGVGCSTKLYFPFGRPCHGILQLLTTCLPELCKVIEVAEDGFQSNATVNHCCATMEALNNYARPNARLIFVYPEYWDEQCKELCRSFTKRADCDQFRIGYVHLGDNDFSSPLHSYLAIRRGQVVKVNERQDHLYSEATENQLTGAVVLFELMLAHEGKSVILDLRNGQLSDSAKRGVFLMYNYARINRLLSHFESCVERGVYGEKDGFESNEAMLTDCSFCQPLLNIVGHMERPDTNGKLTIPRLCLRLVNFASAFSKLYSSVKVLTAQPNDNETSLTLARIGILHRIKECLNTYFEHLSLLPIGDM